ncbi:MAG: hypothetical protein ACTHJM_08855 [Marmoricola sp.]
MQCTICGEQSGQWVYELHADKRAFRIYGEGYTYGADLALCDECRGLWDSGDDASATERFARSDNRHSDQPEVIIGVLRRATAGVQPQHYLDLLPPGVVELQAEGFTMIDSLTGLTEVADFWPSEHRRSLPETRPEWLEEGRTEFWMVRSPSPELAPSDYLNALYLVAEKDVTTPERYLQSVAEAAPVVFAMSPEKIKSIVPENPEDSP